MLRLAARPGCRRLLCTLPLSPWAVLGLQPHTPKPLVKARFYELAKTHHPDVVAEDAENEHSFVEILDAFELLMDEIESGTVRSGTAATTAARGTSSQSNRRRSGMQAGPVEHVYTLGDILCERLAEEPGAAREVWADIVDQQLSVRTTMLEALFRACGAVGGGGLVVALEIFRDAKRLGLLTPATRDSAVIFIIKWCKEDSSSFSRIISELREDERTPEMRETLAYANALYSGYSDGYSA